MYVVLKMRDSSWQVCLSPNGPKIYQAKYKPVSPKVKPKQLELGFHFYTSWNLKQNILILVKLFAIVEVALSSCFPYNAINIR